MDGTERTVIIDDHIQWPNGLTVDYNASRLFWTDAKLKYIHSCRFDGSGRTLLVDDITPHPFALSLYRDTIYWTDWETNSIHACDKYTGRLRNPVLTDLFYPMDIHVYTPERQPIRGKLLVLSLWKIFLEFLLCSSLYLYPTVIYMQISYLSKAARLEKS